MAYRALYRAYRPQSFEEVAGQKHVTQTLKNAIKENKISHAYLFCGPRGTGKTSIAKILAKAINCEHPELGVPCNQCENCLAITSGEHPDILEIDAASNNGVDEVRDLIEKVKYAPIRGRYKVYIIDEVHMMSTGAFNALLKTLEEPPSHVVFILATTEPQKVLPTIISRCQRFDFSKISTTDIVDYLGMVLNKEGVTFEEEALSLIAMLAEGGMRDSLSILEQCLAYSGKNLTVTDVNKVYGIVSLSHKIKFILNLMKKDMAAVLNDLNAMNESGTDIKRLTFDIIQILKDTIIYKNTRNVELLFLMDENHIQQIVPYITADDCFDFIDILTNAMQKYRETSDAKLYFELACMRICNKVHEQVNVTMPLIQETVQPLEKEVVERGTVEEKINDKPQIKAEEVIVEEPKVEEQQEEIKVEEQQEEIKVHLMEEKENESESSTPLNSDVDVSFDDILNILVQANRGILNTSQQKWPTIKRYLANINTAKYASMLMDSVPVAACSGGIILACEHQPSANTLNYYKNYYGVKGFMKNVLNEDFDYIAVTKDYWTDIRNQYLKLRQVNKLPKPQEIILHHLLDKEIPDETAHLSEGQKYALELFGKDIVEFVEE